MTTSLDRFPFFPMLALLIVASCGVPARALTPPLATAIPPALADLRGFRGRIEYTAQRDGLPATQAVSGSITVSEHGWILVERGVRYELRADSQTASVDVGGQTIAVDDVLASDALSNPWAAALGTIASESLDSGPATSEWSSVGLHVFVDTTGAKLVGVSEGGAHTDVSFILDDWSKSGTLEVPGHILRLRSGIPEAGITLSGYRVIAAVPGKPASDVGAAATDGKQKTDNAPTLVGVTDAALSWGVTAAAALACVLVLCLFAVAWTRRDTLVEAWCRRIARDPRGWRRAGVSVFVEPNGKLAFDGMTYRVGPHFYGRAALVQCSTLFVRISAPGAPRVVILPRKFTPADLGVRVPGERRASTGFTLIETLLATALFATVVLGAIYPAVTAVARANAMAAERSRAVVIAANALADEETINEYDGGAPQGSATSVSDGLTLTITVSSGSMRGISDLDVSVADANGVVLAHLASLLGVPVKAPPGSGGGPPGG
jgi:hypothetical protein